MEPAPLLHGAVGIADELLVCGVAGAALLFVSFMMGLVDPLARFQARREKRKKIHSNRPPAKPFSKDRPAR